MGNIKVTVSVEIDAGNDSQVCSRTIRANEGNPAFYSSVVESAAVTAGTDCVEMVAAHYGGRDRVAL